MIFATVGSAFPFDRLIKAMDNWAAETGRGAECLAQIGLGEYEPKNFQWHRTLTYDRFADATEEASVVVAHAGMGSVITAMRSAKPIVMLPRNYKAGEHTTDHQIATARWLEGKPGVFIAWDEADLSAKIKEAEDWRGDNTTLEPLAPQEFTDRLHKQFLAWM